MADWMQRRQVGHDVDRAADGATRGTPGKTTLTEGLVRRRASGEPQAGAEATLAGAGGSGGASLPPALQQRFEGSLGVDLGGVRVHTDAASQTAAEGVGAEAFAVGNQIHFGAGRYDPESAGGQRLLAHEVVHTVQQDAGPRFKLTMSQPGDAAEVEADQLADALVVGAPAEVSAPAAGLARKAKNEVTTPETMPEPAGPETIAPKEGGITRDVELNRIAKTEGGRWYLDEAPIGSVFKHKPGKHQLYPLNPNAAYHGLMARVRALGKQQTESAQQLKDKQDMKYWFCHVYSRVTVHEIEAVEAGTYQYPHMKLQEVIAFAEGYAANLENWEKGAKDKVEKHWQAAFAAAESENDGSWLKPQAMEIGHAMVPSMEAHIRVDLPRAIASCYLQHYDGLPKATLDDFRPDFDAMMPVFDQATADLRPEMNDTMIALNPGKIKAVADYTFKHGYLDVKRERDETWGRAGDLVADPDGGGAEVIDNSFPAAVDGQKVSGTNWDPRANLPGRAKADAAAPGPQYEPAPPCPSFPHKLLFKKDLPAGGEKLEDVIEPGQDLAPYVELAKWTREVRGASVFMLGRASAEGTTGDNANLATSRAELVKLFLAMEGADFAANHVASVSSGELFSEANDREQRCVLIGVGGQATSRQQYLPNNSALPGEVPAMKTTEARRSK